MKRIVVYCSSQTGLDHEIVEMAQALGNFIGEKKCELVYGGVNAGLMHTVAAAASEAGAKVTGIVPEVFKERTDSVCSEVIYAKDLNERKAMMIEIGDVFVILPGGIGTIDEWISTLSHIMVMEHVNPDCDKPIIVANLHGMYNGMKIQLEQTADSIFARGRKINRSIYVENTQSLLSTLEEIM